MSESRRLPRTILILASASPRRAELLEAAGIAFEVAPADIDERTLPGEGAEAYARRLAREKAGVIHATTPGRAVLAADTVVVVDGEIFGKPSGQADARRMLGRLSGRVHQVLTAVTLVPPNTGGGGHMDTRVAVTDVEFARLSEAEIDWYVASGEPADKAGGYAIQGLASRFVTRIEGSYSNVVGLPVSLVYGMCAEAGILLF